MDRSRPLYAALWMLGAVASFSAMVVAGREIQLEMNTFELMLYRSVIGWLTVAAILARGRTGFAQVRTAHAGLHVKRNLFHFAGQNLWFYALATIPLAQLTALEFTNPIWVALLAPVLLSEKLSRPRIAAAALGFLGVLIVARPGSAPLGPGQAAALLAATGFAMNTIYTKQIMRFDSVLCVLFWMTLAQSCFSLALALPGGIPLPSAGLVPWILVVGLTGLTAHYALTSALSWAPASVVAPMEFIRLPVLATLGMLVYGEPFDPVVFLGAGAIVLGNLVNLRGERARTAA